MARSSGEIDFPTIMLWRSLGRRKGDPNINVVGKTQRYTNKQQQQTCKTTTKITIIKLPSLVGLWLVYGWFLIGFWLACGWLVSLWLVSGRFLVGLSLASDLVLVGVWQVFGFW